MNPAFLLLFIAVPLAGCALSVLVPSRAFDRTVMLGIPALTGAAAVYLLADLSDHHVIAHSVGGYVHGLAIPFVADSFTALMILVTSLAAVVCGWFLIVTGEDQYRFVPALVLMMMTGVNGALLTGDMFNFFVWVEVMVLPSYALISVTGTWRRLAVSRMFVIVNLLISTLLLTGVGLVYGALGTVNIAAIAQMDEISPQANLAIGLVLLALVCKAGTVPVHGWMIRSYPNTSAGMMALFSAIHTKVALYAVYRFYATIYGEPAPFGTVIVVIVIVTILVSVVSAFGEKQIRSVLAYQMTSGVGHILIGVALLSAAALSAGVFYMVHHIITMVGLLLVVGAIEQTYGTGTFTKISGLMGREKWAAVLVVLGFFSLIGLPPTSGTWGKIGLVRASALANSDAGWWIVAAIVVGSIISLLVLQKTWSNTFWGAPMKKYYPDSLSTGRAPATALPGDVRIKAKLLVPGTVMIGLSVFLFFGAQVLVPITDQAAESLLHTRAYIEAVLGG